VDARNDLQSLGASVDAVQIDLATESGVDELYRHISETGRPVEVIARNASVGAGGAFVGGADLHDELRIVDLNVRSTVHLAKHVLRDMVDRGEGRVLFTSSIASTMPGSYQAVYNASKSFVQSFALALRDELRDSGVTITSLMPGPADTERVVAASLKTKLQGRGSRFMPDRANAAMQRKMAEPQSGKK
jgi:short-subunit dehydrogenase